MKTGIFNETFYFLRDFTKERDWLLVEVAITM